MDSIYNAPERVWEYDNHIYEQLTAADFRYSLMPAAERKYISGMIRFFKPRRILELGVCDGGGSVVILNAIADMHETKLVSIDIMEMSWEHNDCLIGHAAIAKYPGNKQWDLITDKEPSEVMDSFDEKFDFVVIDTYHIHPVETLNFLSILPKLTDNAIVIVQDISLFAMNVGLHRSWNVLFNQFPKVNMAARLLFDTVVGDKMKLPLEAYDDADVKSWNIIYSNMGAVQINADTRKYVDDLFSVLEFPWGVVPNKISAVSRYIQEHYSDRQHQTYQYAFVKNRGLLGNRGVLYQYNQNTVNLAAYRRIVIYGCGQNTINIIRSGMSLTAIADEVWDINADTINKGDVSFLDGVPLCTPKMDMTDTEGVLIVMTLADSRVKDEIRTKLNENGFKDIVDYNALF